MISCSVEAQIEVDACSTGKPYLQGKRTQGGYAKRISGGLYAGNA